MVRTFLTLLPVYISFASGLSQLTSLTSFANSTSHAIATVTNSSSDNSGLAFSNMCPGATAEVTCSALYPIIIGVIYWLSSTSLYLPPKTIEYDVVQDGSIVVTTATHTKRSNLSTLDMWSYTDLVPTSQRGCDQPYCHYTVDAVYGTLTEDEDYTLTYPTPYGLILPFVMTQIVTCVNGRSAIASLSISAAGPIPMPQSLDYENWPGRVYSSIPGWNESFSSQYPELHHCTWGMFDGQPIPKVVVDQLTSEVTNVVTVTSETPMPTASSPRTKPVVTSATAIETSKTTNTVRPTTSPIAHPGTVPGQSDSASPADPETLVPENNLDEGVGSLILCGLGGPCQTSAADPPAIQLPTDDGPTDNVNTQAPEPETPAKTQPTAETAYTGSSATFYLAPSPAEQVAAAPTNNNAIPIHTVFGGGAIAVGTQTTLSAGGPGATISAAVISAGTDGVHIDDHILPYAPPPPSPAAAPAEATFTLGTGTYTYTSGAGELVLGISSTTRFASGSPAAVGGATLSIGRGGVLNVDGTPIPFHAAQTGNAVAILTVGGVAYTATQGAGALVFGSQTLSAGGPAVTVAGETLSLGSSGVVVDRSTVAFSGRGAGGASSLVAIVAVGSAAYTFTEGESTLVVGPTTLTVGGPAATISGEVTSLGPSGVVVDGRSTVPFSNVAVPTAAGADHASGTGTGASAQYTGTSVQVRLYDRLLVWTVALGLVVIVLQAFACSCEVC